ncbi:ATP-binding cassette domain-containing protein [Bacillus wiedmannii]
MSLLKVERLSHSFIDKVLYENASFDLYKGEHMGIVGQNGAGKSTLMKILVGKLFLIRGALSGNLIFKLDILINMQKLMGAIPFHSM